MSLGLLGQSYGVFIGFLVLDVLKWNWTFGILIYSALYYITGILTYIFVP